MVVRDLDPCRPFPRPYKTNPELIVDPDRVLTGAVTLQGLEPVAWRCPEVAQFRRGVQIA